MLKSKNIVMECLNFTFIEQYFNRSRKVMASPHCLRVREFEIIFIQKALEKVKAKTISFVKNYKNKFF